MRYKGRITGWKDERGFGFITPDAGGSQAFLHISAFAGRSRRPTEGDQVTYALASDPQGRLRAVQVEFVGDHGRWASGNRSVVYAVSVAAAFLGLLAIAAVLGILSARIFVFCAGLSLVAFGMYWRDKSAARTSKWRTPESSLHAIGLVGGWPGALVAMHVFRHKSSKTSFQAVFWVTVVINCAFLGWLTSNAAGAQTLRSILGAA